MYIWYVLLFVIVVIFDYTVILLPKIRVKRRRRKKEINIMEINYLSVKFGLDKDEIATNMNLFIIALINAFIISTVSYIVAFIEVFIVVQLLIGFVFLLALIYALYEIFGTKLLKIVESKVSENE